MHPGVSTGSADTNGTATLRIRHDKAGLKWVIRQLAVSCDAGGFFTVTSQINGLPVMTPVYIASGAAASGSPPLEIGHTDELDLVITGALPSSNLIAAFYYEELPEGAII